MKKITTASAQETFEHGKRFAKTLNLGDVIGLIGELGSGKTTFIKGIAEELGSTVVVTSPTFVLMNMYPLDRSHNALYHLDLYRIHSTHELEELGIEDIITQKNDFVIIEWPEKIYPLIPSDKIKKLTFSHGKTPHERIITYNE